MKQFPKWDFCEVRQLKSGVVTITDGTTATSRSSSTGACCASSATPFYLRGRYEIQVLDSFGRKADCHTMAAATVV